MIERGIAAHIGRVLAAKLQPDADESARRGALDGAASLDRAGEADMIDAARRDQSRCLLVAERKRLEHVRRQARLVERLLKTVADQQRLRGMFQQHRVAGHQCGHDGIDGCEIGIVPWGDGQHQTKRLALDSAAEAFFRRWRHVGERFFGDGDHVARAFGETAHFAAAVADRAAHLPGEFR